MVSPRDTFKTAGSKIICPPSPELSIFTICSEPSESSTFLIGAAEADVDTEAEAEAPHA